MERWVGKVAIVTGASAGIGAAIAEKLAKYGINVVGFARRKEKVEELAKKVPSNKGKIHALQVDISKEDEVVKAFKWVTDNVGPVHVLVNNAGVTKNNTLIDGDAQKWREVFDTNVLGLCVATREAIKIMKENKIDGHIIHMNSVMGHVIPTSPLASAYSASKFAVTALAETLRHELIANKLKIKITSLSPGRVTTEILSAAGMTDVEEYLKMKQVPTLAPEDIADSVAYVLSTPPHVQIKELTIKPLGEP